MGTLLKCYNRNKPLRFSSSPNTLRTLQLRTHPFSNPRGRNLIRRCFSSLSPSQPLTNGKTLGKTDGNRLPLSQSSELWLHNTMSKRKEFFETKVEGKVGMYVCGVTAYDLSHIGHARVYVTFDVLYRYLKHLGYEVCYVRNFTDVDDKIIARANELGEDSISLSRCYCDEFNQDMLHLHCLPPSVEPRVSDHMPQIIDMIMQIVDNGHAYRVEGDVFFSVEKFPDYGQLSGQKLEDNRAGEHVSVDSRKGNPADFALWKACMNCELWVIDPQLKLLKRGIYQAAHAFLNDLYHPLALRLFLMGAHYRSLINYSDVLLETASERIFCIYQTLHDCENVLSEHETGLLESLPPDTLNVINKFHKDFLASMSDDLHTPAVLAALSDPLKTINDLLHTRKGKKQTKRIELVTALERIIRNILSVLGLMPVSYSKALQQLREMALKHAKLTEDQVLQKIEERTEARKNKDYEKSDAIRKDLAVVGISLMDSPTGTSWRPAIPLPLQEQQMAAA